jgi:nucleotide-binding universal stress UspA family protein
MATKILVPLNRSDYSREILPHIEKLMSPSESELVLFYITRPPRGMGFAAPDPGSGFALEPGGEPVDPPAHPIYAHQQEDSIQSEIEVLLLPTMQHLRKAGYETTLKVCFGDNIVEEIVRITGKEKIDLIAMSTRAQDGVRRFFFGDIADKVMNKVKVPVLLMRPEI